MNPAVMSRSEILTAKEVFRESVNDNDSNQKTHRAIAGQVRTVSSTMEMGRQCGRIEARERNRGAPLKDDVRGRRK